MVRICWTCCRCCCWRFRKEVVEFAEHSTPLYPILAIPRPVLLPSSPFVSSLFISRVRKKMMASLPSAGPTCLHSVGSSNTSCSGDSRPSSTTRCADKLFVGLKSKSTGAFGGNGMPNVTAGFHSTVHTSLSFPTKRATHARVGTPRVPYRTPGEGTWQWVDLWNALYRDRVIFIGQHIDEEFSNQILATMLYLDCMESSKKLYLYINGPGGDNAIVTSSKNKAPTAIQIMQQREESSNGGDPNRTAERRKPRRRRNPSSSNKA